jgi:hypothetical protein
MIFMDGVELIDFGNGREWERDYNVYDQRHQRLLELLEGK